MWRCRRRTGGRSEGIFGPQSAGEQGGNVNEFGTHEDGFVVGEVMSQEMHSNGEGVEWK